MPAFWIKDPFATVRFLVFVGGMLTLGVVWAVKVDEMLGVVRDIQVTNALMAKGIQTIGQQQAVIIAETNVKFKNNAGDHFRYDGNFQKLYGFFPRDGRSGVQPPN